MRQQVWEVRQSTTPFSDFHDSRRNLQSTACPFFTRELSGICYPTGPFPQPSKSSGVICSQFKVQILRKPVCPAFRCHKALKAIFERLAQSCLSGIPCPSYMSRRVQSGYMGRFALLPATYPAKKPTGSQVGLARSIRLVITYWKTEVQRLAPRCRHCFLKYYLSGSSRFSHS